MGTIFFNGCGAKVAMFAWIIFLIISKGASVFYLRGSVGLFAKFPLKIGGIDAIPFRNKGLCKARYVYEYSVVEIKALKSIKQQYKFYLSTMSICVQLWLIKQ